MMENEEDKTEDSFLIDINEIQKKYIPLSKKKIRSIVNTYFHTIRCGSKILVERDEVIDFISNKDRDKIV
jgi:hypothetical protein